MVELQHDIGRSWADAIVRSKLQRVDNVVIRSYRTGTKANMLREDEFRTNTNLIVTDFLASCEGDQSIQG